MMLTGNRNMASLVLLGRARLFRVLEKKDVFLNRQYSLSQRYAQFSPTPYCCREDGDACGEAVEANYDDILFR